MSYGKGNLISLDYTFEVDTSNLDTRLDEIEQKIADLGGEDIMDEDRVQGIIDNAGYITSDDLDGRDYAARDDVDQIVRDLMHSEGDDFVQGVIDNGGYVTEYEVDDKIRDALTDATPDEDAVRTIVESVTDGRLHRLEERLDNLQVTLHSQVTRIEVLEARTSGGGELGQALTFFGLLRQAFNALRI